MEGGRQASEPEISGQDAKTESDQGTGGKELL